jgi:hypothetical protein
VLIRMLIGVALLAAAVLCWRGGGTALPPPPVVEAARDVPQHAAGVLAGLPPSAVGRKEATTPTAADAHAAGLDALHETEATGSVRGILVDGAAEPLARRVVLLRRGTGVRETRLGALTDDDGMFHFPEVAVGTWQAGVLIPSARGGSSAVALAQVEIVAAQRSWVDLWLTGTRAIRGRILLEEDDLPPDMVFEVEARPVLEPGRVAADAIAAPDAVDRFEPAPARAELERRVVNEYLEENPGAAPPTPAQVAEWSRALAAEMDAVRVAEGAVFELGGLPPGRYALRVYLDAGRECWAEFEADLGAVDAEFGLLRLGFADFPLRADG